MIIQTIKIVPSVADKNAYIINAITATIAATAYGHFKTICNNIENKMTNNNATKNMNPILTPPFA